MNDVTRILNSLTEGEQHAAVELLPAVYAELRKTALAKLKRESTGQTLQATALVHEAWLRIAGKNPEGPTWRSRGHFFGAAAEAMRRILIENARRKNAIRHGGGQERVDVDIVDVRLEAEDTDILVLNEALEEFEKIDAQKAQLVKLRYFAGLTIEEAADTLGISPPTAKRQWAYARAWLFRRIQALQRA